MSDQGWRAFFSLSRQEQRMVVLTDLATSEAAYVSLHDALLRGDVTPEECATHLGIPVEHVPSLGQVLTERRNHP